jgi:hypothetical protein
MPIATASDLPSIRMTEQTRSLPSEIVNLIGTFHNEFSILPTSVVVRIFENLNYSGRSCLALTCKDNARIAVEHDLLMSSQSAEDVIDEMDGFFSLCDRDLPDLKFCLQCGVYKSRREDYWRHKAEVEATKIGGLVGMRWRDALSKHGIDVLIYGCLTRDPTYTGWSGLKSRVCPECMLVRLIHGTE